MIYQPKVKFLNKEEVAARIKIIRKSKSIKKVLQAKEDLWLAVYKVIISVASSYNKGGQDFEALVQAGSHGVMVAIERFDVSKNVPFNLYTFHYIRKYISAYCYESRFPITGRQGVTIQTQSIETDYKLNTLPIEDLKSQNPMNDFINDDLMNKLYEEIENLTHLQRECLMIFFYGTTEQKKEFHKNHNWKNYWGIYRNKNMAIKKLQKIFKDWRY